MSPFSSPYLTPDVNFDILTGDIQNSFDVLKRLENHNVVGEWKPMGFGIATFLNDSASCGSKSLWCKKTKPSAFWLLSSGVWSPRQDQTRHSVQSSTGACNWHLMALGHFTSFRCDHCGLERVHLIPTDRHCTALVYWYLVSKTDLVKFKLEMPEWPVNNQTVALFQTVLTSIDFKKQWSIGHSLYLSDCLAKIWAELFSFELFQTAVPLETNLRDMLAVSS